MATPKQPPSPPAAEPRPPRLSRERILRAALGLVEREGLETLSMRRLAQELDVWPMSVYRYFRDKDELVDSIAASAAEHVVLPGLGDSWRVQMRKLLNHARDALGADPSGLSSRLPRAFLTPAVLRLSEGGVAILVAAGFTTEGAARAWRALWSYTLGFTAFTVARTPDEVVRRTRTAITALPADEFPTLVGMPDEFASALAGEDEFDYGLERLLDGLEATLGRGAAQGS